MTGSIAALKRCATQRRLRPLVGSSKSISDRHALTIEDLLHGFLAGADAVGDAYAAVAVAS
jgi:hypothetical protein